MQCATLSFSNRMSDAEVQARTGQLMAAPLRRGLHASPTSDDVNPADIAALRLWLRKQPHLPQGIPDEMLAMFLHAQYNSLEMAKLTLDSCYTVRTQTPEFFSQRDPLANDMQDVFKTIYYAPLPRATPEGYRVFMIAFKDSDPSRFQFVETVKTCMAAFDVMQLTDGRVPGYRIVIDMTGAQMGHVGKANITMIKKGMDYQDGISVRLKGIHIINATPLINQVMAISKPFMKQEMKEVLRVHTEADADKFYQYVPHLMLPKEYGGDAPTMEDLHCKFKRCVEQHAKWLQEESALRVDEARRPGKSRRCYDIATFGCEGSFKKLNLD